MFFSALLSKYIYYQIVSIVWTSKYKLPGYVIKAHVNSNMITTWVFNFLGTVVLMSDCGKTFHISCPVVRGFKVNSFQYTIQENRGLRE